MDFLDSRDNLLIPTILENAASMSDSRLLVIRKRKHAGSDANSVEIMERSGCLDN